jgi:hypothetical protein
MLKNTLFTPASAHQNTWWIALVCVLTLGASACGALPANGLTQTPTTLMGVVPPNGQPTGIPTGISTAIPTAGTAVSGNLDNVCSLINQSDAEAVLSQTVTAVTPGSDANSFPGGTLYFCTYLGSGLAVVVSEVDMGSPAAAGQAMQQALAKMLADNTTTTIPQQSGPGDQNYWSTSLRAAQFTVLKGNFVFSVLVGGNISDPSAYKAGLLSLAESVAAKR